MGIWILSDLVPPHFVSPSCKQASDEKWGKKLFHSWRVSVCVCLPVNRALIALALQLGDFQSKKKKKKLASTRTEFLQVCHYFVHFN